MKNILLVIFLSISFNSFSQGAYIISGKVVNASTGAPMQGASVFAQNTTIGTATNAEGNFKLWLPAGGYDLVITFTGFSTESQRVTAQDGTKELQFNLSPKAQEIEAVAVVATNEVRNGWVKYGRFFVEEFIGKSENSRHCYIRNPEVLKFFFSRKYNRLKVVASEPLFIENRSLGYILHYSLDSFTHEYATKASLYSGAPLFEEIPPTDDMQKKQWDEARLVAYNGSILHFMRSLFKEELEEEGFEIQMLVKNNDKESSIPVKDFYAAMNSNFNDSLNIIEVNPSQRNVGVLYKREKPALNYINENEDEPSDFQFSFLNFQGNESLIIEQNGYYYEQSDITINAYWTWERIADLLPYNYGVIEMDPDIRDLPVVPDVRQVPVPPVELRE